MHFLKTLLWVLVAVVVVLFASANWNTIVTVNLWSGLQADIKLPVLAIGMFAVGFLAGYAPKLFQVWSLKRRLEAQGPVHVANAPAAPIRNAPPPPDPEPRANI